VELTQSFPIPSFSQGTSEPVLKTTTALTMALADAFTAVGASLEAVEGAVEAAVGVSDGLSSQGMVVDVVTIAVVCGRELAVKAKVVCVCSK
jgi:hypothetical protein